MSVTSALFTGVTGLLANGDAMNVIGNNISNVNTVGFKEGRSLFSDLLSQNIGSNGSQIGKGVQMQAVQNIFTQGASQTSENVTDLSIQGNSFFLLQDPNAGSAPASPNDALLSRAGAFHIDSNLSLVNADGYQVLGTDGLPVTFGNTGQAPTTDFGRITKIDSKGVITYLATDGITQCYYAGNGTTGIPVTGGTTTVSIATATAADPGALVKAGNSVYTTTVSAGVPIAPWAAFPYQPNGSSEKIISNSLEQSNVDMASEFVKMIVTQRAYTANSKTITTTDQMTQDVLGLIR